MSQINKQLQTTMWHKF